MFFSKQSGLKQIIEADCSLGYVVEFFPISLKQVLICKCQRDFQI